MTRWGGFTVLAVGALLVGVPHTAFATPNDTTFVVTFENDFYNWATPHIQTFEFPPASMLWSEILMYYKIGCPEAPNDCDPWDRLGHLRVLVEDSTRTTTAYEIARIVTPYDITGGSRPGTCTWVFDVSAYESLLHDTVTLRNYIESWIGGDDGWLVTITFAFIAGVSELEAYKVENLWTHDRLVYGDPERPIEDHLQPIELAIDAEAIRVLFRAIVTGHGQGNTHNAAEFSYKWHGIDVGGDWAEHYLWRSDCADNTCSPQGGTWQYNRAGWCPGDGVTPWDVDVTASVAPGEAAVFNYDVQPYENFCRPNNPDCVDGVTCPDCDSNYTGHTEPHYTVKTQVIHYRPRGTAAADEARERPTGLRLGGNRPNPFGPATTISYAIEAAGRVTIAIFASDGRLVREVRREHTRAGEYSFTWDGRDDAGGPAPTGTYFYEVQAGGVRSARQMILLR